MQPIIPMEPKSASMIPEGNEWIAQIKWDGVRILTYFDGTQVRLFNRKQNERTLHYPELLDIHSYCAASSVILDGEVIALGNDGKPSFHEIMRRDRILRFDRVKEIQSQVPITYMIFDVLYYNGDWITSYPFERRAEILTSIIKVNSIIQMVESYADANSLFEVVKQHRMEGIVLKKRASQYKIGAKGYDWLKVKNIKDLIAVVGGFTINSGVINALLLGLYDREGRLWYIGHCGSGKLTQKNWRELTDQLQKLVIRDRPFCNKPERNQDAFWVEPKITVKVHFLEWTEKKSLRQPSIQAITQTSPSECVFEFED